MLCDRSPPLCVSLLSDLNQQNHKCSESRQRHDSSLSWRCEYFVSVCLCLCIIMNWQLVIYNLRGESFSTCCGSWSQTALSIDMFVFLSFTLICVQGRLGEFWKSNEHRRFMNIIFFVIPKADKWKRQQIEHSLFFLILITVLKTCK